MKIKKHKSTIARKVTSIVSLAVLAFIVATAIAGYLCVDSSVRQSIEENYSKLADLMAEDIGRIVDGRIKYIKAEASSGIIRAAVAAQDANSKDIQDESATLKSIMSDMGSTTEILITDKHGALVAATRKTPDLSYADKEWWKEAFDGGKGKVLLGDIVFNETINVWTIPFVVPIKNELGEVIGIWRSMVDVSLFFEPLKSFKAGNAGEAVLIDDKSYLIYRKDAKPYANKFCEYRYLQTILQGKSRWLKADGIYGHTGNIFMVFSKVNHPLLLNSRINWMVVVIQNAKEVFAFTKGFLFQMLIAGSILIVLALSLTKFAIYGLFGREVDKVREGMAHAGMGDMEYKVALNSMDEIGELADSFNAMTESLKKTVVPLSSLNNEIAERKRVEAELDKMARLKSALFSIISGLRSPVSIARDRMNSVFSEIPDSIKEKHKRAIDESKNNIDKVAELANNLADISMIEEGKIELRPELVDIRSVIRKAIFNLEPKIRENGLDLKMDIPKSTVNIYADFERMVNVFVQLIENAIKFTENGYIQISVKELKNDVECSISDTGAGIPAKDMPGIFELFSCAEDVRNTGVYGSKLNLSIVKGIIEKHKGKIWAESEVGKGAKFTFILPKTVPAVK